MDNFYLAATPSSPEIEFDFSLHHLRIRGESYPENAAAFYGDVIKSLRDYLANCTDVLVTVDIALAYFNSSSTKMLFNIFEALNDAHHAGNHIVVNWYHDEEDDTILEFGQELSDDFPDLTFINHAVQAA